MNSGDVALGATDELVQPAQVATGDADPRIADPVRRANAARRITGSLFFSQSLGSAGTIAAATVAAIVGEQMTGRTSLAGITAALSQVGVAVGSLYWSRLSDRLGRRVALTIALLVGAAGAVMASAGVAYGMALVVFIGLALSGSGTAALQLGRFVAAEVNLKAVRARAIAIVVLGGTAGSVLGPMLVGPTGRWATARGFDETAGPYLVTALGFLLVAGVFTLMLRPEPLRIARAIAAQDTGAKPAATPRPLGELLRRPAVRAAIFSVVTAHMVMVGLMQMTSLHMHHNHHPLTAIGLVFSGHTLGMFGFSIVTGWLTDRWGRRPMLGLGAVLIIVSCLTAPLSPEVFPIAAALFLLGLGWNFCYVAGSALLSDALEPSERGSLQGFNDLLVGGAAATAAMLGSWLLGSVGYAVMGIAGAALCLPLLYVVAKLGRGFEARA